MGPFEVLSKVGENGYVIDIPSDWGIHSTFNIEDLVAYKGSIALPSSPQNEPIIESNHTIPESAPNLYPESSTRNYRTDNIESILDDQVTVTRDTWFSGRVALMATTLGSLETSSRIWHQTFWNYMTAPHRGHTRQGRVLPTPGESMGTSDTPAPDPEPGPEPNSQPI